jgi:hypothetical protein
MDNMTTTILQRFKTWLEGPDGGEKEISVHVSA